MSHSFYIPVLGLGYSVDTPIKVAKYGISSTVSIVNDILIERMRKFYLEFNNLEYVAIEPGETNSRARRIKEYLNLMLKLVNEQFEVVRNENFEQGTDITKYFELLPEGSPLKAQYTLMLDEDNSVRKAELQNLLREQMKPGAIDVNIMSKVDRLRYSKKGEVLEEELSDALTALEGFALSNLSSSVILSAGMNPRLYSYLETFSDFYPNEQGEVRKKIILKVSDYRSAFIQGKFLAKKGLWVSEFRIESGLNCGGHAFATEGYLMGPILEEFKVNRETIINELFSLYSAALTAKGIGCDSAPKMNITAQGGIGTAEEQEFLLEYFNVNATGWCTPFLLVPEATNVDNETLANLVNATPEDFYVSDSSPLGVLFNNFRNSSSEILRKERIAKGRPGSPCTNKYLAFNTEFTKEPICTASREYQSLKIKQLQQQGLPEEDLRSQIDKLTEKVCLCVGLSTSALIKNNILKPRENKAVAICPGPNISWFKGSYSLEEMVKHIYGKMNLLGNADRPNMFINELQLYLDYWKKEFNIHLNNAKENKRLLKFKDQLEQGISYYKELIPKLFNQTESYKKRMIEELERIEEELKLVPTGILESAL